MDAFRVDYFLSMIPKILKLLPETVKVAVFSLALSLVFGLLLAIIRQYRIKGLNFISSVYVSFFRGTPFIGQLFLFYYGFAQFSDSIKEMSPFTAVIIALSCNYCAFMSEDIRAALNSVDKGQYEAGLSIGLRPFTVIRKIVLPQAARIAVPGLSNNFINLFYNKKRKGAIKINLTKKKLRLIIPHKFKAKIFEVALWQRKIQIRMVKNFLQVKQH